MAVVPPPAPAPAVGGAGRKEQAKVSPPHGGHAHAGGDVVGHGQGRGDRRCQAVAALQAPRRRRDRRRGGSLHDAQGRHRDGQRGACAGPGRGQDGDAAVAVVGREVEGIVRRPPRGRGKAKVPGHVGHLAHRHGAAGVVHGQDRRSAPGPVIGCRSISASEGGHQGGTQPPQPHGTVAGGQVQGEGSRGDLPHPRV